MKPKSVRVHNGMFLDKKFVTLSINGATKYCTKHLILSKSEAITLARDLLDDVSRLDSIEFKDSMV